VVFQNLGLLSRLKSGYARRAGYWLARRMCRVEPTSPIVSFTFDDFPRSALKNAGSMLVQHGFSGTYYTSFGLIGERAPTGEIFHLEDVAELVNQGHELGCHTYHHRHAWDTEPEEFEASIVKNREALTRVLPGGEFKSLSYPIGTPRPRTKRIVGKHFECARGGGQTFNRGQTDMARLNAFFLEQSRDDFGAIRRVVDVNLRAKGWLIFATHDVTEEPTRFGCEPQFFADVVQYVASSGSRVLPVYKAWQQVQAERA
jgi:peptidoglycan/xylan/chitin deacetylase (PgdA/CDA1 family)